MFGQRPTFGSTSTASFGGFGTNPSSGFGSSSFGRPVFGTPQTTSTTTPFGTATSTGTSLFGQNPSTGSGGLFGSTSQSTGFGTTSGFGTSGGGLFGSQANTGGGGGGGGGLFSGGSSAFNTQNQARPFSFGTPTTSTSTSLFGSANTGTSLFSSNMAGGQVGTTVKYNPVTGTDTMNKGGTSTSIQTKIEVITAMKEYETKSLEELRVEDYVAGRKGSAGFGFGGQQNKFMTSQPSTLFGTGSNSNTLFGQKPAENKSLFGTPAFGTATSGGGLFGSSAPTFGQSTTASSTGFSFGQNKPGGAFSFAPTTSSQSLFGAQNTSTQPAFSSTGFGFGNQNQTGFGQNKPAFGTGGIGTGTGLFGQKPATGFGTGFGTSSTASPFSTTNTSTGLNLFGAQNQNKPTGFTFGTSNAGFGSSGTGFGAPNSIFGQSNQPKPGGLNFGGTTGFGTNTSTGFNCFGSNTGTGMFGANTGGGLFGNAGTGLNTGTSAFGSTLGTGMNVNSLQPNSLNINSNAVVNNANINNLIKALTHNPFGNSSLLKTAVGAPTGKADELLNSTSGSTTSNEDASKSSATKKPTYVLPSKTSSSKPRPIGLNKSSNGINVADPNHHLLFAGLDDSHDLSSEDPFKPKTFPSVKKLNLRVFKNSKNDTQINTSDTSINGGSFTEGVTPLTTPLSSAGISETPLHSNSLPPSHENSPTPDIIKGRNNIKKLSIQKKPILNDTLADLAGSKGSSNSDVQDVDLNEANKENANISLFEASSIDNIAEVSSEVISEPHPSGIKLTRSGYYTLPSLNELSEMIDGEGKCLVENFTVGRYGYGNVCFPGITNVYGLDLDSIVFIVRKEVEVYPEGCEKPEIGEGLNKPAFITLDCVWPVDKTTREIIKSEDRLNSMGWSDYLERQCLKMESTFVEYRSETGSWLFKVKHFSKYGLEEDENGQAENIAKAVKKKERPPPIDPNKGILAAHLQSASNTDESPNKIMKMNEIPTSLGLFTSTGTLQGPPVVSLSSIQSPSSELLDIDRHVDTFSSFKHQDDSSLMPLNSSYMDHVAETSSWMLKKTIIEDEMMAESSEPDYYDASPLKEKESKEGNLQLREPRTVYQLISSTKEKISETQIKVQHFDKLIPMKSSLLASANNLMDMSGFMSRSFRVGWGPGWKLVHAGQSIGIQDEEPVETAEESSPLPASFLFTDRPSASSARPVIGAGMPRYVVTLEKLSLEDQKGSVNHLDSLLEACLQNVLELSSFSTSKENSNATVHLEPLKGIQLLHRIAGTSSHIENIEGRNKDVSMIFNLCICLWGELQFYDPERDGKSSYIESQQRKESLSLWLEASSENDVEEEVKHLLMAKEKYSFLNAIFSYMSSRQISDACELAQDNDHHHLALLLSQICLGSDVPRQIMQKQLLYWADYNMDAFIPVEHLTLYSLIAGLPVHKTPNVNINTCQGLDWRRALGIHLWYVCPATATISEAVLEYEKACGLADSTNEKYCLTPLPPYTVDKPSIVDCKVNYDICYHLLKLFVDPSHSLDTLLETSAITCDPLDLTTSWLVWSVLQSLEYTHMSENKVSMLHLGMASLLESMGHWHWAVFILLFIKDNNKREKEINDLLDRHLLCDGEMGEDDPFYREKEYFLLKDLQLPSQCLYRSKAIRAKAKKLIDEEAWYQIKAGNFERAHSLIVESIAPNAIINEDYDFLFHYLNEFKKGNAFNRVRDWDNGGCIYLDYLKLFKQIRQMKQSYQPNGSIIEEIRPRLLELCSKLNNLKCTNAVQKFSVCEMSQVVVSVLRTILGEDVSATKALAEKISSLPFTYEYALQELNLITNQYLTQVAMET